MPSSNQKAYIRNNPPVDNNQAFKDNAYRKLAPIPPPEESEYEKRERIEKMEKLNKLRIQKRNRVIGVSIPVCIGVAFTMFIGCFWFQMNTPVSVATVISGIIITVFSTIVSDILLSKD